MRLFLKKSNGVVTLFVVMIMIPTIFLVGFMDDLARLKLAGNQAVIAADNYGEIVMEQYDNILKELYGLFAMTQMDGAAEKLADLDKIVKASFDPNSGTISAKYTLDALQGKNFDLLAEKNYNGFMPFKSSDVELMFKPIGTSSLASDEIIATQIGDFMKFRIFPVLFSNGDLLKSIQQIQDSEADGAIADAKQEYDEEVQKIIEKIETYYRLLRVLADYPEYIDDINSEYEQDKRECWNFYQDDYEVLFNFHYNEAEAEAAFIKDVDTDKTLSDDENMWKTIFMEYYRWIIGLAHPEWESDRIEQEIYERYENDGMVSLQNTASFIDPSVILEDYYGAELGTKSELEKTAFPSEGLSFDKFETLCGMLSSVANEITSQREKIEAARNKLQTKLEAKPEDDELRKNVKAEVEITEKLFEHIEYYKEIVAFIYSNKDVNTEYKFQTDHIQTSLDNVIYKLRTVQFNSLYQDEVGTWPPGTTIKFFEKVHDRKQYFDAEVSWEDKLDKTKYKDFKDPDAGGKEEYKKFYEELKKTFDGDSSDEAKKKGENKKKEAERKKEEAENGIKNDENTINSMGLRDYPSCFTKNDDGKGKGEFSFSKLGQMFSFDGLANFGNQLLLKFYVTEYDFSMLSSRVTNVKEDENKESLTGYAITKKINYLYKSELEYLLAGNSSSKDNLNYARNRILGFRAVMNFASTYKIPEINHAIRAIGDALVAFPVLSVAVVLALRAAVTAIETGADWREMMKGEKVAVFKAKLGDLTEAQAILSLLGADDEESSSDAFSMSYEQYLMIMILLFASSEEVYTRTGDIIELNVNTVIQKLAEDKELSAQKFFLSKAYTAADITCSIKMDFLVMPGGFARTTLGDGETYDQLNEFKENRYNFTITRGY
ncbi:MAG: DUF5702 domain-containing protein [Lachnospiraceae bacterium]|nr:DUF5702 domain-containing protein [Lachnospiraceae bacterium]